MNTNRLIAICAVLTIAAFTALYQIDHWQPVKEMWPEGKPLPIQYYKYANSWPQPQFRTGIMFSNSLIVENCHFYVDTNWSSKWYWTQE